MYILFNIMLVIGLLLYLPSIILLLQLAVVWTFNDDDEDWFEYTWAKKLNNRCITWSGSTNKYEMVIFLLFGYPFFLLSFMIMLTLISMAAFSCIFLLMLLLPDFVNYCLLGIITIFLLLMFIKGFRMFHKRIVKEG